VNQAELYTKISAILWEDWDPIGINDSAPRDEYRGYIPLIFDLKLKGSNVEKIAQALFKIETEEIGGLGNIDHCREIAAKIVNL
jgi:hypothetical protein